MYNVLHNVSDITFCSISYKWINVVTWNKKRKLDISFIKVICARNVNSWLERHTATFVCRASRSSWWSELGGSGSGAMAAWALSQRTCWPYWRVCWWCVSSLLNRSGLQRRDQRVTHCTWDVSLCTCYGRRRLAVCCTDRQSRFRRHVFRVFSSSKQRCGSARSGTEYLYGEIFVLGQRRVSRQIIC